MALEEVSFDDLPTSDEEDTSHYVSESESEMSPVRDNKRKRRRDDMVASQAERMNELLVPEIAIDDIMGETYNVAIVPRLNELFANEDELQSGVESKIDWPDDNMKHLPGLKLIKVSQANKIEIGKKVITDLHEGISQRTIACIFICAWNLNKNLSSNIRVYPERDPTRTNRDVDYKNLLTQAEPQVRINHDVKYVGSDRVVAEGLSFFCGTLFRLFSKTAENYMAAWPTIQKTFSNFYGTSFPLENFHPSKEMIERLRNIFTSDQTYRNTLTGFLYAKHPPGEKHSGVRNFMHEIHLAFTGMHCLPLFIRAWDGLGTTRLKLLSALYRKSTKRAVTELAEVLVKYGKKEKEAGYGRDTWRFASLFSSEYFANMQSRRCPELLMVLSGIISKIARQDSRNNSVYKIAHISRMSRDAQKIFSEVGVGIYCHFMAETEGIENDFFTRAFTRRRGTRIQEHEEDGSSDEYREEDGEEDYELDSDDIEELP